MGPEGFGILISIYNRAAKVRTPRRIAITVIVRKARQLMSELHDNLFSIGQARTETV